MGFEYVLPESGEQAGWLRCFVEQALQFGFATAGGHVFEVVQCAEFESESGLVLLVHRKWRR